VRSVTGSNTPGDRPHEEGDRLHEGGDRLHEEGDRLREEGDRLAAERPKSAKTPGKRLGLKPGMGKKPGQRVRQEEIHRFLFVAPLPGSVLI
jgi:hypothetical protein